MDSFHLLHRLIRECLRYPFRLVFAVLSLAGLAATQLALPWVVKSWVEGPLVEGATELGRWSLVAFAVVVLVAVFLFSSRVLLASVNQRMLERLRSDAVTHLLFSEPEQMQAHAVGDIMARVFQDAGMLSGFVENLLKRFLGDGILAAGALVMMFVLHPGLAAVACLLAPVIAYVLTVIGKVVRRWGAVAQTRMGGLSSILSEQLQGFSTVKGHQAEAFETKRFVSNNSSYRSEVVKAQAWSAALVSLVFLLAASGFVAAVAYGSRQVAGGAISAGGLLAFCLYAGQTIEPLRRLAEMHGQLQQSLAAADRLFAIPKAPGRTGEKRTNGRSKPTAQARSIDFEDVGFRYGSGPWVVRRLNLNIKAGEHVAVVGASGEGKSTIASLLVRFLAVEEGRILLDGENMVELPLSKLRSLIRVVEQEPFLFSGALVENIRYGSFGASRNAVEEAARMAGMWPWITADPRGLDAPLGEAGREVSGGQRQRVALARAILSDPDVLILDEATSALDSEAETAVLDSLSDWLAQRTVLVMAHRLSTVLRAPRIVLLADGAVADQGSGHELKQRSELFRGLFSDQLQPAVDETPVTGSQ